MCMGFAVVRVISLWWQRSNTQSSPKKRRTPSPLPPHPSSPTLLGLLGLLLPQTIDPTRQPMRGGSSRASSPLGPGCQRPSAQLWWIAWHLTLGPKVSNTYKPTIHRTIFCSHCSSIVVVRLERGGGPREFACGVVCALFGGVETEMYRSCIDWLAHSCSSFLKQSTFSLFTLIPCVCGGVHAEDPGVTITVADTHSDSSWFGEICVEQGYKHKAFVSPQGGPTVKAMQTQLWTSKQILTSSQSNVFPLQTNTFQKVIV